MIKSPCAKSFTFFNRANTIKTNLPPNLPQTPTIATFAETPQAMNFEHLLAIALTGSNPPGKFSTDTIARLDRLGAFNGRPALRFIAITAMRSGITDHLHSAGACNTALRHETDRFIAHTGFKETLANGFFDAYVRCINRLMQPAPCPDTPPVASSHGKSNIAEEPYAGYSRCPEPSGIDPEPCGTSLPAISINRDSESECGVTIEHASVNNCSAASPMLLNVTLTRTAPMGSGTLHYSFHNACGAAVTSGIAATMTISTPSPHNISIPFPATIPLPAGVILTLR